MKVTLSVYEKTLNELDKNTRKSKDVISGDLLRVLVLKEFETNNKQAVLEAVNQILDNVDCGCSKGDCPHAEARDAYRFRIKSQICPKGGRNLRHSVYMRANPNHPGWNTMFCDACGADVTPVRPK